MNNFADHVTFVCFAGVTISLIFLSIYGWFKFIDYLTKGKLSNFINNLVEE